MQGLRQRLRKDGWLFAALAAAILLCFLSGQENDSTDAMTQEEARIARILSAIDGAGCVEVAVFYSGDGAALPCGAVIVADGADDIAVQLRLSEAVATLLGVDHSEIGIFKRKED